MIDIERKIRAMSAELAAAEERVKTVSGGFETDESAAAQQRVEVAKVRLALLCDLRDELLGRFPGGPGTDDPLADYCEVRPDFERTMVLTIEERLEDSVHSWDCTVRMPDGRLLTGSLDDDMPQTPGDAVKSAGVMLDAELALERWNELWSPKTGKLLIKDRSGPLPDPEVAMQIKARLSSGEAGRLERASRAWWDFESKLLLTDIDKSRDR